MSLFTRALLILLLCFPVAQVQAERVHHIRRSIQIHKEQACEVDKRIEQTRAQIEAIQQKQHGIIDQLDQMELELQLFREKLETLKHERTCLRREIREKRGKLEELGRELDRLQSFLGKRLEVLYKFGKEAYLNLLLSASDAAELQHHWVYLRAVAEQDNKLIRQVRQKQAEEEKLAQELDRRENRLGKLVQDIEQQKAEMERVKGQQVTLLQDIHHEEEMYRDYVQELSEVAHELNTMIDKLERRLAADRSGTARSKGDFASKKGTLPYPVRGKVVSRFGTTRHEKFGTTIRNSGIDISTEESAPVVAVYAGQVLYSGWVKGYGRVIIIEHGDKYYSLTAHLSEIHKETGELVQAGEVIGLAGYAPVKGEGGRVYFEIRHRGNALDPQAWLLPVLASATGPAT
ncbi:MAG: murein hydrolase activator EnvC family protein [Syntrophobacteria bacterium]